MRIGVICEGGPVTPRQSQTDNPDARVIERLVDLVGTGHTCHFRPLGNKPVLQRDCGTTANLLLTEDGCDLVLIVWDLYPAEWGPGAVNRQSVPCQREDRLKVLESLKGAAVDLGDVVLLCFDRELENVLLLDHKALSVVLSKPHRRVQVGRVRGAITDMNPKKALSRIFSSNGGAYNHALHNPKIASAMVDSSRIIQHSAVARLRDKLAGLA